MSEYIYYEPREVTLNSGQIITLRQAGLREGDALEIAAVHVESFNQNYIAYPNDADALRDVFNHFKNKTIGGYEEYWLEQIEHARDPKSHYFVLVAETPKRIMNNVERPVIEAFGFFKPVEDEVWGNVEHLVPYEYRDQSLWQDWYLGHIRDQFRREGIGGHLFAAGKELTRDLTGARHMFLNAFKGNGSVEWFDRLGSAKLGECKIPYCGVEPDWVVTGKIDFANDLD